MRKSSLKLKIEYIETNEYIDVIPIVFTLLEPVKILRLGFETKLNDVKQNRSSSQCKVFAYFEINFEVVDIFYFCYEVP